MATRYVIERVANQATMRRIKDTAKGKYVRQPHGADVWDEQEARIETKRLNDKWDCHLQAAAS